jgi:DNA-binding NarL/FixJ family response regulator
MHRQLNILLVDDNSQFTERLSSLLKESGPVAEIKTAPGYEEAQTILAGSMPDLVLLDIYLPGRSGIELLKFIRKAYPDCCVMMVTNQAGEPYRNLCLKLGANYFFDKTKDLLQLSETVRNYEKPV